MYGSSALKADILVCVKYNDFILKSKQLNNYINKYFDFMV